MVYRLLLNKNITCLGAKPAAGATVAGLGIAIARELFTNGIGFRIPVSTLHIGDDPLESMIPFARAPAMGAQVSKRNLFLAAAVKNDLTGFLGQLI